MLMHNLTIQDKVVFVNQKMGYFNHLVRRLQNHGAMLI